MRGALLLAHGSPDSLDDDEMADYLTLVRGGRRPSPELVEEMRRNYAAIGGRSPLKEITWAQARALEAELSDGTRVFVGMRNSRPFVADALSEMARDAVTDVVAIPMAPQYSRLSVGKYEAAVDAARPEGMQVRMVKSWHDHPGLLDAFAEKAHLVLARDLSDAMVFTAHSLPLSAVREGDPYAEEVRATAAEVALRVGVEGFHIAWQSAGRTEEAWLSPSLEQTLGDLAGEGRRRILVVPVGFVSDHMEILYDLDIVARRFAQEKGIALARTESLNTSPTFIHALADIVRAHRG